MFAFALASIAPFPAGPDGQTGLLGFINVALDAPGSRVFAAESGFAGELFAFDASTGAIVGMVETGKSPVGLRFNPARNEVYVANREGGTVAVVDAATLTVKRQIELPEHPNSLALSSDGQVLYASVKQPFPQKDAPAPLEQVVRIDLRR